MQKTILLFVIIFISFSAYTQKYDYRWMMGYGDPAPGQGTSHINFNYDPPTIYLEDKKISYYICNNSMSTIDGELIFYSNGVELYNAEDEIMLNSEDFNYNEFHEGYENVGLPIAQGLISFQSVSEDDLYYLFHLKIDYEFVDNNNFYVYTKGLYYTSIDIAGDNGYGEVIEKGIPIIEDTLASGGLTATRHANGRDWWILMPEIEGNRYYRVLLDPDGVHLIGSQDLGSYSVTDFGQATFSPDGSWYIRNHMIGGSTEDDYLDLYRFDRCTGLLSDHERFVYGSETSAGGGVIVSPNNRFLYAVHREHIYQLDLESDDILASLDTIAVYDGFSESESGLLKTTFFLGQSAPDGKIYLNCTNGTSYLHLIHNPNGHGANCFFEQRGVKLPTRNFSSLSNFPFYRLGPIDGSPCDTLGIDNIPLAAFNYYADSSDYLTINFWDYSFYEPKDWEWNFGDNETDIGQTPVHTYSSPGIYEVCLTASNEYGSDSLCKLLELSPVGVREILPEEEKVVLFPNPVSDELTLSFAEPLVADAVFQLFNALGQKVRSFPISRGQRNYSLSMSQEQQGIYFYTVESEGEIFKSGKLIIQSE